MTERSLPTAPTQSSAAPFEDAAPATRPYQSSSRHTREYRCRSSQRPLSNHFFAPHPRLDPAQRAKQLDSRHIRFALNNTIQKPILLQIVDRLRLIHRRHPQHPQSSIRERFDRRSQIRKPIPYIRPERQIYDFGSHDSSFITATRNLARATDEMHQIAGCAASGTTGRRTANSVYAGAHA